MRRMRFMFTGLTLLALTAAASPARAGQFPQDHNGWYIGLGVGGGSAGLSDNSGNNSDRTSGAVGSFRVGVSINPNVALGVESSAWTKSENGATVTFDATTAGVAWFPSQGWVIRGGVGIGSTTVSASSGNVTVSSSETGLGVNAALGYEFRLARSFALGPQLETGYASFKGGSSNWAGLQLAANWYFLPTK